MKDDSNPMHKLLPMHGSLRCKAKSKRSKRRCKGPAVKGWEVCRMHGARSGAPKGAANGAYRHGHQTQEAQQARRTFRDILRATKCLLADLKNHD